MRTRKKDKDINLSELGHKKGALMNYLRTMLILVGLVLITQKGRAKSPLGGSILTSKKEALSFLTKKQIELKKLKRKSDQDIEDALYFYNPKDRDLSKKTIFILGGMGPEAGFGAFKKTIKRFPNRQIILDQKCSTPDRTEAILEGLDSNKSKQVAFKFKESLTLASRFGDKKKLVDFYISCNTAHAFLDLSLRLLSSDIREKIQIHSLIELGSKHLQERNQNPLILATTGTRKTGLYKKALAEKGLRTEEISDSSQEALMKAIYQGVKGGDEQSLIKHSKEALKELKKKTGRTTVLAACTEIPLLLKALLKTGDLDAKSLTVIDPLELVLENISKS